MAEKTEAQKRAQRAYMERFAVARVRMEREKYEAVQAHAEAHGESVNSFINRAIAEAMERDSAACTVTGGPAEGTK
ncbi:Arc family DNA-binding protein [Pseudoflavonifractor phocaeensis]|uniref:Arc family DNA-binding protein n=1 Tax=Pseudoflavonifractor phocaeensis TaxID=1870988 RepID=UPI00195BB064|nr:Arc family DNA-binding protein [Pseudoflavonifractor phocaeensis]MBM6924851.1 Arc family DNA-binding protein [Pseudoflavonifractor phocaeensis]